MISDTGLGRFLNLCAPTLERLDISYTKVEGLDVLRMALFRTDSSSLGPSSLPSLVSSPCKLTKLVISGLSILSHPHFKGRLPARKESLIEFFDTFASQTKEIRNRFHTLKMGFMGNPPPPNEFIVPDNLYFLDSSRLNHLIPSLHKLEGLRNINLRGNVYLAKNSMYPNHKDRLARFIRLIGRRCYELDLSDIPRLGDTTLNLGLNALIEDSRSIVDSDDEDQIEDDSLGSPRLTTLVLNKTDVSDESKSAISTCKALESLFLQDTKITSEGLEFIIQNCSNLCVLDLTSCRGVPRAHRRDFFSKIQI